MGDFASILYKQFFLRDFLGKICPGAIVMAGVLLLLDATREPFLEFVYCQCADRFVFILFFLAFLWFLGMGAQLFGEAIRFISPYPSPWRFKQRNANYYRKRLIFFTSDMRTTAGQRDQRERYVVIKEACGNMATSLLITAGAIPVFSLLGEEIMRKSDISRLSFLCLATLLFALLFRGGHLLHHNRQAHFEIDIYETHIQDPDISAMRSDAGIPK